jgi:hypothetical protein
MISGGYEVADCIGETEKEEFERKLNNYNRELSNSIADIQNDIDELITGENQDIIKEIEELNNKESIQLYKQQQVKIQGQMNVNKTANTGNAHKILHFLSKQSSTVVKMSFKDSANLLTKTTKASGSQMHKIVYNVGKFFGHKFKSWEAVKSAGRIGKGAMILGPVLIIWAAHKKEKQRKLIQEEKNKFSQGVRSTVKDVRKQLDQEFRDFLKNSYDVKIQEVEDQKRQIIKSEENNSKLSKHLDILNSKYVDFIELVNS